MIDIKSEVSRVINKKYIESMIDKVVYDYEPIDGPVMACMITLYNEFVFAGYSNVFADSKEEAYDDAIMKAIAAEKYAMWDKLVRLKELGGSSL